LYTSSGVGDARGLTAGRLVHELRRGGRPRPYGRSACTVQAQRREAWGEPPRDVAFSTGPLLPAIRRGEMRWGNPRGGYWIFRGAASVEWIRPSRVGGAIRPRGVERFAPGGWSDSLQSVERFAPVPWPVAPGHSLKIPYLTGHLSFSTRFAEKRRAVCSEISCWGLRTVHENRPWGKQASSARSSDA